MAHSGNRFKQVWDPFLYFFQMHCIVYLICVYLDVYSNSFDFITFEKIIAKQSKFVSDRTTKMQFSKI